MNTLIFRTISPLITVVMVAFSIFVMLRGHNEPGGGFIGGLIAAAAIAIYGIANGPLAYAGFGVLLAGASGLLSAFWGMPYLTGLWFFLPLGSTEIGLSTPLIFDIGVYFTVFGTISAVALMLEDSGEGE
jgi:multicomponent Na+:H+ antiporter subunit B